MKILCFEVINLLFYPVYDLDGISTGHKQYLMKKNADAVIWILHSY